MWKPQFDFQLRPSQCRNAREKKLLKAGVLFQPFSGNVGGCNEEKRLSFADDRDQNNGYKAFTTPHCLVRSADNNVPT